MLEKDIKCELCGHNTNDLIHEKYKLICNVCYSTCCGNAIQYKYENRDLFKALAQCTNLILDAINKKDCVWKQ